MDATSLLADASIVPVVVIDDVDVAVPLAETLLASGLKVIEVTLRTDSALTAIERIARDVPEMITGAGSVRAPAQFDVVRDAGARFAVSPGSSQRLIERAAQLEMPFIPGAATASEMISLQERGYTLQKFFPAEVAGGVAYLKAVGAPLPELRFMPTGGISAGLAAGYLRQANVACVGGSWIAPPSLLAERDFEAIAELARDAAKIRV